MTTIPYQQARDAGFIGPLDAPVLLERNWPHVRITEWYKLPELWMLENAVKQLNSCPILIIENGRERAIYRATREIK